MAIPPLSEDELRTMATMIVIGVVTSVSHQKVSVADGTNMIYTAQIDTIEEEDSIGGDLDETITATYWQIGDRPNGWAGNTGQHSGLPIGKEIRLFLGDYDSDTDTWELLEPNGWESLDG